METSKEKILNAAIAEFSRFGFDGARVDRIAKRAKVNKAMIYYHFPSKEALYETILHNLAHNIVATVTNTIQKAFETGNPIILVEAYAKHISSLDKQYFMIIIRELASGGKYIKKIIAPTIIEPMTQIIGTLFESNKNKTIKPSINPQFTMIHVAGAVIIYNLMRLILQGTSVHSKYFSNEHVEHYIQNLCEVLAHGIIKEKDI